MPFQPCMLGIVTLPFSVQYLPHVCQLDQNPNPNRMVLRVVKKEVEMVFHPSTTQLDVFSITKYVPWSYGAERNKSGIMALRFEIFH